MTDRETRKTGHRPESASPPGNTSAEEISRQLRTYYNSIVEEGVPDQFLDLLEKLHKVDVDRSSEN